MRFVCFLFIFILPAVVFASSHIASFEFVTPEQTIAPNDISEKITLQFKDLAGEPTSAGQTACLQLISSSASGEFSSNNDNWSSVNVLTINSNWTSRNFYYKDQTKGTHTLTANLAFRPAEESRSCPDWPVEEWGVDFFANQKITVGQSSEPVQDEEENSQNQPSSTVQTQSKESGDKKITIDAGPDRAVTAGASARFSAEAVGFEGEPLTSADFLWSFGDGAFMRGRSVFHTYRYPGKYKAVINVTASGATASDTFVVSVVPNEIIISEVKPGDGGWIELYNGSNFEIDLSGWAIANSKFAFYFPKNTKILGGSYMVVPYENSEIKFLTKAELLYPSGSVANSMSFDGNLKDDESFHAREGGVMTGLVSPGEGKFIVRKKAVPQIRHVNEISTEKEDTKKSVSSVAERKPAENGSEVVKNSEQVAAVSQRNNGGMLSSPFVWFGAALLVGILGAGGFFFLSQKNLL